MERDLAKIKEENPENWFEDVYRMYKDRTNWFNYTDTYSNLIIIGSTRFWDELKFWCSPKAIEKFFKNSKFSKIFDSKFSNRPEIFKILEHHPVSIFYFCPYQKFQLIFLKNGRN